MNNRALAVFIASFFTILAHYAIRYSYGTLLPGMLPALDISKAEAGVIYSSYFITYMIFSPIMGSLSDKYDMRLIISLFSTIMGAGAFLMQFPAELWQACLFFAITGIGCAACWAPIMALNQRWTSDEKRGLSLALVDAGSTIGVMAAGAVIPMLVAKGVFSRAGRTCFLAWALFHNFEVIHRSSRFTCPDCRAALSAVPTSCSFI